MKQPPSSHGPRFDETARIFFQNAAPPAATEALRALDPDSSMPTAPAAASAATATHKARQLPACRINGATTIMRETPPGKYPGHSPSAMRRPRPLAASAMIEG